MLVMERRTWPRLYVDLLKDAHTEGYNRPSREGETVEIGPALLKCPAPVFARLQGRNGSDDFARLEQLCYLAGLDPSPLTLVAPRYERFRENNGSWFGAYGLRLLHQLPHVVEELTRHPFSRRGVAMIWTPEDISHVNGNQGPVPRDIPCTVSLTYWVGPAGDLRCQAHMRSCDLWFGLYYDMPAFAFLQRAVAKALRRPTSLTFLNTSSLHLYNKHLDRVPTVRPRLIGLPQHPTLPDPPADLNTCGKRFHWLTQWAYNEVQVLTKEIAERMKEAITT